VPAYLVDLPLLKFSPLLGIFGLFGPAIAAIIMAAVTDGKSGVKALLGRVVLWRVGLPWYVIALGLPTILSLATAALAYLAGATEFIRVGALAPIELVLFVLVVGEELGWRGYALPRLLEKRSALTASLILGVLWGLWHLPTFLVPGTPQYGLPLTAFVLLTIEYSILMTWVFIHTLGSVLIATLFHGAINLSQGLFVGGIDGATRYWLLSIVYGVAAIIAAIALARSALRKPVAAPRSEVGTRLLLDQLPRPGDLLGDLLRISGIGQCPAATHVDVQHVAGINTHDAAT
jgi:membrane protease YdiL (CAAX protease family)